MNPAPGPADPGSVLERVREVLGAGAAVVEGGPVTATPRSDEETAALLRAARERQWRVLPRGAGIGWETLGGAPDLIVSTLGMSGLLEHGPADLICRSRAGLTLSALQDVLAAERQWLALDPPGGPGITLGGIVATGAAGPLQLQYGRPRDQLLGLTLVDGEGRILRLGGRVVKNVAGFDLVRLTTGSRGTIGVITEVTFRVYPLPEEDRTLVWSWEELEEAWTMGRKLANLPLPLAAAELVGGIWAPPLDDSGYRVMIRITGSKTAVERIFDVFMDELGHPLRELKGDASRTAARVLSEGDGMAAASFRAHTLPSRGRGLLQPLASLPLERWALHLSSGTFRGTLHTASAADASSAGDAASVGRSSTGDAGWVEDTIRALRGPLNHAGGTLRLRNAAGLASGVERTAAKRLASRIVRGFDPAGTLPGRWGGGTLTREAD